MKTYLTLLFLASSLQANAKTETITIRAASESGELIQKDIRVENKRNTYLFEGDIIVENYLSQSETGVMPSSVIISGDQYRWAYGVVPYSISPNFSSSQENQILQSMETIEEVSGVVFVQRTNQSDYVNIFNGQECSSSVGKIGGKQNLSLADNCFSNGTLIHELLHALGFWHEQSREDRNNFVTIHWNNILEGKEHNFNQHIFDGEDIGPYDYSSIMHYSAYSFSNNNEKTITRKNDPSGSLGGTEMSNTDESTLQSMYGELQEVDLNVNHRYCYGMNSLNWASYLDEADYFQIQIYIDGAGFVDYATTSNKAYQVNVSKDTQFRVKACNNLGACSFYSKASIAKYSSACM